VNGEPRTHRRQGEHQDAAKRNNLGWYGLFAVASLIGGLAASAVTHESVLASVILSLIIAGLASVLLSMGVFEDSGKDGAEPAAGQGAQHRAPPGTNQAPPNPNQARQPGPGQQLPTGHGDTLPMTVPVRPGDPALVQLVQPPGSEGGWWQGSGAAETASRSGRPVESRQLSLSGFLDHALIAQCPRCGSFRVRSADNRSQDWPFDCLECAHQWTWRPGTAWPPVQVRPRARRGQPRPQ
jgi:hypothetical protein